MAGFHIPRGWTFGETAKLGQRQPDQTIRPISAALFGPGDFVQATMKFDVSVMDKGPKDRGAPTVVVRLALTSLVQLVRARDIATVSSMVNSALDFVLITVRSSATAFNDLMRWS